MKKQSTVINLCEKKIYEGLNSYEIIGYKMFLNLDRYYQNKLLKFIIKNEHIDLNKVSSYIEVKKLISKTVVDITDKYNSLSLIN